MGVVQDFVKKLLPYAKQSEAKTGINALAILTQAAQESAWGRIAPGNMYFGQKDTDGLNGNEQLLTTTEYMDNPDVKFPVVLSVQMVMIGAKRRYKYKIKDWFRKYKTPEESFTSHAEFFFKNSRYRSALEVKSDPSMFLSRVAAAGYATDPSYNTNLQKILKMIQVSV